jgi:RNA polymerase sigma factor (sigma-70 family)
MTAPTSSGTTPPGPTMRYERLAGYLERARAGDLSALDQLVPELNPLLWHVARAQELAPDDAADVVQTTWLELLRHLHDIRSPVALTAWLVTTARREAWRLTTRRRGVGEADPAQLEVLADTGPDPIDRLAADQRNLTLWRQFQRLPERCRELLRVVAQVDRPDYDVVAQALQMPRGSIGPTRGRCLNKLRAMLLADPEWSTP